MSGIANANGLTCEKCNFMFLREYDPHSNMFVLVHPTNTCPDSGKRFKEFKIALEELR